MFFASIFLSIVIIFLIHFKNRYIHNGPPGPIPLPIIGNLYQIGSIKPQEQLDALYKKYGKIVGLWMGSCYTVVLNEPEVIQNAFSTQSSIFSDRYLTPSLEFIGGLKDLSFSNSHTWKKLRMIFGNAMTKSKVLKLEDMFLVQIEKLTKVLKEESKHGHPINIKGYIRKVAFNIMFEFMFSMELSYNEDDMNQEEKDIMHYTEALVKLMAQGNPGDFIPSIRPICNFNDMEVVVKGILDFSRKRLDEHIKTFDKENPRDFIDLMLVEVENDKSNLVDNECIVRNCLDLLVAGTDTTTITIQWFILLMSNRLECQDLVYKELIFNSEPGKPIDFTKRAQLPILQSSIKEGMRLKPTSPLGLPHITAEDTELEGYFIPKGTQVIGNAYSACLSESVWKNPHEFDPRRYLNQDNIPITFGTGLRRCVGVNFAELSIFLINSNLFKTFKFLPPTDYQLDEVPRPGLILEPPNYKVIIELR